MKLYKGSLYKEIRKEIIDNYTEFLMDIDDVDEENCVRDVVEDYTNEILDDPNYDYIKDGDELIELFQDELLNDIDFDALDDEFDDYLETCARENSQRDLEYYNDFI